MPPSALPFSDFLDLLRERGMPVGMHEYGELAKLLSRWKHCNIEELGIAIAALVGRTPEECSQIEDIFREVYTRFYDKRIVSAAAQKSSATWIADARPSRSMRSLRAVSIIAVVTVLLGYLWFLLTLPGYMASLPRDRPQIFELRPDGRGIHWQRMMVFGGASALLALAIYGLRQRRHVRRFAVSLWNRYVLASRSTMSAPSDYTLDPRYLHASLSTRTLTLLSQLLGAQEGGSRVVNVAATAETSARALGFFNLIYYPSVPSPGELHVWIDVSAEMAPWKYKIRMLLDELAARGVSIERWHFDAEPQVLWQSDGERERSLSIATLRLRARNQPLWIISVGGGTTDPDGTRRSWVHELGSYRHAVWLTPITFSSLWPATLRQLPLPVHPLTEEGICAAALAAVKNSAAERAVRPRRQPAEPTVTAADCAQLRRLLALVPDPDVFYALALRLRFLPAAPEEIVLYVLAGQAVTGGLRWHWSLDERERLLRELRTKSPHLEAEARAFLLNVLQDSEPSVGSPAHMRWRLSRAQQQLGFASGTAVGRNVRLETEQLTAAPPQVDREAALQMLRADALLQLQALPGRRTEVVADDWGRLPTTNIPKPLDRQVRHLASLYGKPGRGKTGGSRLRRGLAVTAGGLVFALLSSTDILFRTVFVEHVMSTSDKDLGVQVLPDARFAAEKYIPFLEETGLRPKLRPIRRREQSYAFLIGMSEINQSQYRYVMDRNPSKHKDPLHPVETVAWLDAIRYANSLSRMESLEPCYQISKSVVLWPQGVKCLGYRLPTRAEWLQAEGGDYRRIIERVSMEPSFEKPLFRFLGQQAWCLQNSSGQTHPVMTASPNDNELFDMLGNVAEWLWEPVSRSHINDVPPQLQLEEPHVAVGGSFRTAALNLLSVRISKTPSQEIGFRIVRTVSEAEDSSVDLAKPSIGSRYEE